MVSVSAQAVTGMRSEETEKGVRHFHDTLPPPSEVVDPVQNPYRMHPALVLTLRETFLPTNRKVITVQFADQYYIPCPYRTCTLQRVKAFTIIYLADPKDQ
jgi:hypothetical protein